MSRRIEAVSRWLCYVLGGLMAVVLGTMAMAALVLLIWAVLGR